MDRTLGVENPGRFIGRVGDDFVVWDRSKNDFVLTGGFAIKENDTTLDHLKDVYQIAKTHGFGEALSYDWKGTKARMKSRIAYVRDSLSPETF